MPQNLGYLFAAFAITWAAFFAYLFFVQRMLLDTGRRLRALEREPMAVRLEPPRPDTPGTD
jgi:hypothetical protein